MLEFLFWLLLFIIFYAYVGYGILLFIIVKLRRSVNKATSNTSSLNIDQLPDITLLIAAYNEEDFIGTKIRNSLELEYPREKLRIFIVTDGSSDKTAEIAASFPEIRHFHLPERKGKLAATERIIPFVTDPILVFSDANTLLNKESIRNLVRHYTNEKIGVVSGEKRILSKDKDQAAGAGEGFYWKYESKLKKWDFELYSTVGAAGELFSIRTSLYRPIPADTIIEDFCLSMRIAEKGYIIAYEPDAYAIETASASSGEELKRKIRIAAGGIQAIFRFRSLLNPFRHGVLSFQYLSHRVLRWSLAPFSLIAVIPLNYLLYKQGGIYEWLWYGQLTFYSFALIGYLLQSKEIKSKLFFIPYYFLMMNYAVVRGFFRYLGGSQSAVWEKAMRADSGQLQENKPKNAG